MSSFCLNDYDCVGFDLDHTLARYNLPVLSQLIYDGIRTFLVEKKNYPSELLAGDAPYDPSFIHKGLLLDIKKGNLLKLSCTGVILRASHGCEMLSESNIVEMYGPERRWPLYDKFKSNMFDGRSKLSKEMRCFKDFFDMPASLVAARLVDLIDRDKPITTDNHPYTFWPDILEALIDMFRLEAFSQDSGGFFPALKDSIEDYVIPCSAQVRSCLKNLREVGKTVFMITGSNFDYASYLTSYCLGVDWRDYFDVVITFAGKPGFFTGHRDFWYTNGEVVPSVSELRRGGMYRRGNYVELKEFLNRLSGVDDPRVVYFGDNLTQDVFTPAKYCRIDTVAIVEEIEEERKPFFHKMSKWGSLFRDDSLVGSVSRNNLDNVNTLWGEIIVSHSKIAVPSLDAIAEFPIDTNLHSFF